MFRAILSKLQGMDVRKAFVWALVAATIITALMPFIAYKSSRDPVVGEILGSCIIGMALLLTAMVGHSCDSYFTIYIFFALTILHAIVNVAISISFPLFNILVLNQIILVIVGFFHARNLRFGSGGIKPQYQYRVPDNVRVEG